MIIIAKRVVPISKPVLGRSSPQSSVPAPSVVKRQEDNTKPQQSTTKPKDSPKVGYTIPMIKFDPWNLIELELTEKLAEASREHNTRLFRDRFIEGANNLSMREASRMLNRNAWKIERFVLIPSYGEDPETEWSGFVSFIDRPNFYELECHEDDYRTIVKRVALYAELLDLGE